MNATITSVNPETREWQGDKGLVVFVSGSFADGSQWSVGCKPENVTERMNELEALVGKPGEFELQAKNDYKGTKQWGMKAWPGKPSFGGGGGGGFKGGGGGQKWTESYAQSREGKETEQRSIQRAVALEKAHQYHVAFAGLSPDAVTPQAIIGTADIYFAWLSQPPETASEYRKFIDWFKDEVEARGIINKPTLWKAAMTFANQAGYDHDKLKTCSDANVFKQIKDKLTPATHPKNGDPQQPNAYQRQPVHAAPQDDELPW